MLRTGNCDRGNLSRLAVAEISPAVSVASVSLVHGTNTGVREDDVLGGLSKLVAIFRTDALSDDVRGRCIRRKVIRTNEQLK